MAIKNLNIKMNLMGASQSTSKMRSMGESISRTIGQYLALGLAVKGTLGFFKDSLKLYGIQEQAEKSLQTALGHTSNYLLNRASALQKITTYGDEEIIQAQALIAAFVKEENAIDKATQATLDLASAKGMDLKSAADLVAKSLGSSTNALSRYGIEVHGAVGSTERLQSLVKNVSKLFGGQAKSKAETYAGSIKQLSDVWGDLKENVAKAIADNEGVMKFLHGLTALISAFGKENREMSTLDNVISKHIYNINQLKFANLELAKEMDITTGKGKIIFLANLKQIQLEEKIIAKLKEKKEEQGENNNSINKSEQAYQKWREEQLKKIAADELEKERMERLNEELFRQAGYYDRVAKAIHGVPWSIDSKLVSDMINKRKDLKEIPVEFDKKGIDKFDDYVATVANNIQSRNQAVAMTIQSTLSSAFMSAFLDGEFSAERFFDSIKNALLNLAIQAAVMNFVSAMFPGTGGFGSSLFGGGFASGGYVEAGTRYLVGEGGPEMFIPSQDGQIVPNAGTTINVTFNGHVTDKQYVETHILPQLKKAVRLGRA